MSSPRPFSFAICIPTYKRPQLLQLLLADLAEQTLRPDTLVIVDGDPASGDVRRMLTEQAFLSSWQVVYQPSNYGNLSYQRYLGWRLVARTPAEIILYFDDDQRITQRDLTEWLVRPFASSDTVGVGCFSRTAATTADPAAAHLIAKRSTNWLVQRFGSRVSLRLQPGQLTPTGSRVALIDDGRDYFETSWLQGRIMAYSMNAISQDTFSADLFALDHIRCGLGEDTFLSRRVGARGKLLYTFRAVVDHPNADTPKSYPFEAYNYAYAATYSRRFQNDYYRVYQRPTRADRLALLKSYCGGILLAWARAIRKPDSTNFARARGTLLGTLHGLTRPPTAQRLTPGIDWWKAADEALVNAATVQQATIVAGK